MSSYLPTFRGGRAKRNNVASPNSVFWEMQATEIKHRIRLLIDAGLWNAVIDDDRIPSNASEQELTFIFRRIKEFIYAHSRSEWTVENLVVAGMQLEIHEPILTNEGNI